MVKLDMSIFQYLEEEDFRVLSALEMVIRNHELAPIPLIERIANLPRGGAQRRLRELLKYKLIHHDRQFYDGYAMKYAAFDYLALHVFARRGVLSGVGSMIGCGKESDIYNVCNSEGEEFVLKLQRLGRCSFRSVARNRQYTRSTQRRGASWFYLSRLAATKEFAYLTTLYEEGFPVPKPIDHNRHAIVMERVKGCVLSHVDHLKDPTRLFQTCMKVLIRFAEAGLIHGDFNEFNLMIRDETEELVVIDFPQMVSTKHKNAHELFERDVRCIHNFFKKKFKLTFDFWPTLSPEHTSNFFSKLSNSNFTESHEKDLQRMLEENPARSRGEKDDDDDDGDDDDDDDDDDDNNSTQSNGDHNDVTDSANRSQSAENSEDELEGSSKHSTSNHRELTFAVCINKLISPKDIRSRLNREKEKKSFNETQKRSTRRNQFKTKDRRRTGNVMKEMRDAMM